MKNEKITLTGFVVEKFDRQESDRVFKVFTKELGQVFVLAKSIRVIAAKMRMHMEVGKLIVFTVVPGKEYYRLVGVSDSVDLPNIMTASDLVGRFVRGEESYVHMFDKVIELSNEASISSEDYLLAVGIVVFADLGYLDIECLGVNTFDEYLCMDCNNLLTALVLHKSRIKNEMRKISTSSHL